MDRERPLDPHSEGDLPHREGLAKPSALPPDHDTLEHLDALAARFDDARVHLDRVARPEVGQVITQTWFLDEINFVHGESVRGSGPR